MCTRNDGRGPWQPGRLVARVQRHHFVQTPGVPQILFEEGLKTLRGQLPEEAVEPGARVAREKPVAAGPCSSASFLRG